MTENIHQYDIDEIENKDTIRDLADIIKMKTYETGTFSETVGIDGFGFLIDHEKDGTPITSYMVAIVSEYGTEGLYKIAKGIENNFPYLKFKFEQDTEGKWIKCEVKNLQFS